MPTGPAIRDGKAPAIPKKRAKHYSYDEGVNESPALIEDEAVEVEADIPSEENESVETIGEEDEPILVAFEEQ